MSNALASNTAAEARFIEEGHRCHLIPGGAIRVVSDTHHDKHYIVSFIVSLVGDPVTFTCTPEGTGAYRDDHLTCTGPAGVVPCKHAAGAARRLAREGLIVLDQDGRWAVTAAAAVPPLGPDDDPFAGMG